MDKDIMRILIAVFGFIWTYMGMFFVVAIYVGNANIWQTICIFFALIFGANCFYTAFVNYKGGWSFLLGGSSLVVSSFPLVVEIKNYTLGSNSNFIPVFLMFVLSIIFLLYGHRKHLKASRVMQNPEYPSTDLQMSDSKPMILSGYIFSHRQSVFLLVTGFLLGLFNTAIQHSWFFLTMVYTELVLFQLYFYWVFYFDKANYHYRSGTLLNTFVIIFPIIALIVYIFRTRAKEQAYKSVVNFLAVLTYCHALSIASTVIWIRLSN